MRRLSNRPKAPGGIPVSRPALRPSAGPAQTLDANVLCASLYPTFYEPCQNDTVLPVVEVRRDGTVKFYSGKLASVAIVNADSTPIVHSVACSQPDAEHVSCCRRGGARQSAP